MTQIQPKPEFASLEEWANFVQAIGQQAVNEAIERHRRLGESIVIWRDGQIIEVPADQIPAQVQSKPNPTILKAETKA